MRFGIDRRGMLLVISAPSGGGKSAVLRGLLAGDPSIGYSVSYTSRPPRLGETDGQSYHFVSRDRATALTGPERSGLFRSHAINFERSFW